MAGTPTRVLTLVSVSLFLGDAAHAVRPAATKSPGTRVGIITPVTQVNSSLAPGDDPATSPTSLTWSDGHGLTGPHADFSPDGLLPPATVSASEEDSSLNVVENKNLEQGGHKTRSEQAPTQVGEVEPESPGDVVVTGEATGRKRATAAKSKKKTAPAADQLLKADTGGPKATEVLMDGKKPGKDKDGAPPVATDMAQGDATRQATKGLKRNRKDAGRDPLDIYLHEINETPLLSAAEEKELAYWIEQGDAKAHDHMVRANLRLVVNIARGYVGRGLSLQDLIQEGSLGLIRAVNGFNPRRNMRFSTYATYWIKEAIGQALIKTGKTIRISKHMQALISKWHRAKAELEENLGRLPTDEEITQELKVSKKAFKAIQEAIRVLGLANPQTEDGHDVINTLVANGQMAPDEVVAKEEEARYLLQHLDELEPREAQVLRLRFGLGDEDPKTFTDIGRQIGVTRERARQIEIDALGKLRKQLAGEADSETKDDSMDFKPDFPDPRVPDPEQIPVLLKTIYTRPLDDADQPYAEFYSQLDQLDPEQATVLRTYLGLDRETPQSVAAIAQKIGKSRKQVGPVITKAQEKLLAKLLASEANQDLGKSITRTKKLYLLVLAGRITPKEAYVLRRRFKLDGPESFRKLEDLAKELDVTVDHVLELQKRANGKLSASSHADP